VVHSLDMFQESTAPEILSQLPWNIVPSTIPGGTDFEILKNRLNCCCYLVRVITIRFQYDTDRQLAMAAHQEFSTNLLRSQSSTGLLLLLSR
jgi:hypothetical protein